MLFTSARRDKAHKRTGRDNRRVNDAPPDIVHIGDRYFVCYSVPGQHPVYGRRTRRRFQDVLDVEQPGIIIVEGDDGWHEDAKRVSPGRNEPCPCGSGRKYKHCCLAREREAPESAADATWRRVRRVTGDFPRQMARFFAETYGGEAADEAWAEFTLWDEGEFDPDSALGAIFLPWMYHSWSPDPHEEASVVDPSLHDRPPTSMLLERRGARLDPLHRRYLEACLQAPFSFHEIVRCDRGHGFRARDVITGEEHEVLERSATESMSVGDVLFGQLVPIDGIVMLEACSPYVLGPADKIPLIELRDGMRSGPGRDTPPQDLLRQWDFELREHYLEAIARFLNPTPPVLHNTDGELLLPQRVAFAIDSAEAAFAALKHLAAGRAEDELLSEAERDPYGRLVSVRFDWLKPGNRLHASWDNTILGGLTIKRDRLVADVNSMERAETLRSIVEEALGTGARYLGSELPDAEEETGDPDDHAALAELPEVREHLNRMIAAHYDDWITQEIPALGDRRPIDAVADAAGRESVEALVQQMERDSRRMQPPPDEAIFARLRERLGLDARD